jgi:hypothetical protein
MRKKGGPEFECLWFSVDTRKLVLLTHAHTGRLPTMIRGISWENGVQNIFYFYFLVTKLGLCKITPGNLP